MAKYKNKITPSKEAYMTLILENLMEIFSLSKTEVYTFKKAISSVKKKFKQVDLSGFSKLDEILKELQISKEFLKYVDEIQDTSYLLVYPSKCGKKDLNRTDDNQ